MSTSKVLLAVAAMASLVAVSASADAQSYRRGYHRHGYSRFNGRARNYSVGLGLRKQTRTGGPAGGQSSGGGG